MSPEPPLNVNGRQNSRDGNDLEKLVPFFQEHLEKRLDPESIESFPVMSKDQIDVGRNRIEVHSA
jgi:hypothetical protein